MSGGVLGFGGPQRVFHCVYAFVAETGYFDVGADFGRLRGQTLRDVGLEFGFYNVGREVDFVPDVWVAKVRYLACLEGVAETNGLRDQDIEHL